MAATDTARRADTPTTLGILVVDDHPLFRAGVKTCLGAFESWEVSTGAEAILEATRRRPDVVLLDLNLPDLPGSVVCAEILKRRPATAIVVVSASDDEELVVQALDAGARGFLLKDAIVDLPAAIQSVIAGAIVLDSRVEAAVVRFRQARGAGRRTGIALSPQEIRILRLAAEGFSNREIGDRLYLSRHTVKEYLGNAMRKLKVASRVEAVLKATHAGLLGQ
jgi:DNA-binding NarL/FixJ family response regulator